MAVKLDRSGERGEWWGLYVRPFKEFEKSAAKGVLDVSRDNHEKSQIRGGTKLQDQLAGSRLNHIPFRFNAVHDNCGFSR